MSDTVRMLEEMKQTRLDRDLARADLKRMIEECDALRGRVLAMNGEVIGEMSNERLLEVSKAKLTELYEVHLLHCLERRAAGVAAERDRGAQLCEGDLRVATSSIFRVDT